MLALFPEITACVKEGNLEKLADTIRHYFAPKTDYGSSFDPFELTSNFGIPVRIDFLDYFGAIAVSDTRGDIKASIVISRSSGREQQAFTLCHLLGHFILHIQPSLTRGEWRSSGFKELNCPLRRYAMTDGLSGMSAQEFAVEDLADRFAAALMMPATTFQRTLDAQKDLAKVAHVFGVTVETVMRRKDDLEGKAKGMPQTLSGAQIASTNVEEGHVVSRIKGTTRATRDDEGSRLLTDVNQPVRKTSRVVATHSYSDAALSESKSNSDRSSELKGMERIRELARKMDKFGDNSK